MKKYEILLAQSDEDPYHPALIRWTLENKGYQVSTSMGSGSAIEMLHKNNFDLVITDLLVVLDKTKELNSENVVILLLNTKSGMLPFHDIRFVADDYLFIPFELAELEVRVSDCIDKLELRRRNGQTGSYDRKEKIDYVSQILAHDIRGSLISMADTLNRLSHVPTGEIDEGYMVNSLERLLSRTLSLIGLTEECLEEVLSVTTDSKNGNGPWNLGLMMIYPVLKALSLDRREQFWQRPELGVVM